MAQRSRPSRTAARPWRTYSTRGACRSASATADRPRTSAPGFAIGNSAPTIFSWLRGSGLRGSPRLASPGALRGAGGHPGGFSDQWYVHARPQTAITRLRGAGQVNFADLTRPCEFTQYGASASTASFQLSYDQLGFPVEVVREAGRILPSSPVYSARAESHRGPPLVARTRWPAMRRPRSIGDATLELVRAMISSACRKGDDHGTSSVMDETLCTRIEAFIHNHLADPGSEPGAHRPASTTSRSGTSTSSGRATSAASPSGS